MKFADRKGGFPHSEISGSKGASASPELIAACYVLHRLSMPRHPSEALMRLIVLSKTHARGRCRRRSLGETGASARTCALYSLLDVLSPSSKRQGTPDKPLIHDVNLTTRRQAGNCVPDRKKFPMRSSRPNGRQRKARMVEPDGIEPTT